MYNLNYELNPQGWRCPGCGRYYSPTQPMCLYCGGNQKTWTSPHTTNPISIDDSQWWEEYLKQSSTGKSTKNWGDFVTSIADSAANIQKDTITWSGDYGNIHISDSGAISWTGPMPDIKY